MLLTVATALAELLAEVAALDARTALVARLCWWVVTRSEVVHVVAAAVLLQLNLATVHGPQTVLLLLLAWRRKVLHRLHDLHVSRLLLRELVHLRTRLVSICLRGHTEFQNKILANFQDNILFFSFKFITQILLEYNCLEICESFLQIL